MHVLAIFSESLPAPCIFLRRLLVNLVLLSHFSVVPVIFSAILRATAGAAAAAAATPSAPSPPPLQDVPDIMIGLRFLPNATRETTTTTSTATATASLSASPRPSSNSDNKNNKNDPRQTTPSWMTNDAEMIAWPASRNPCNPRNTAVVATNGTAPCWRNTTAFSLLHMDCVAMRGFNGYGRDAPPRLEWRGATLARCYPFVTGMPECMMLGAYYCSPHGPPPSGAMSAAGRAIKPYPVTGARGQAFVVGVMVVMVVAVANWMLSISN